MPKRQFKMYRSGIPGVEAVEAQTSHSFARHTHEQFGIGLMFSGAQKSLSGRGMVEAGPGDIITVNPNEVHDGTPIGEGRAWRILYFDPSIIADAVNDASGGRVVTSEIPHPVLRNDTVAGKFQALFAAVTDGNAGGLLLEERLLPLIAMVLCEEPQDDKGKGVPSAILAAQNLIDDDPLAPVSLADLARESGLSRFQVLRGFARATGLTPHAYLVQRRIHLARRLIAAGTGLAEAAFASGFADQSHMTRVFVSKYGFSPGIYAAALA